MESKLILFEGIPGSGKSTFSRKTALFLKKNNINTHLYMEGCLHPANLDGYAVIKVSELKDLVENFPSFKDRIYKSMIYFNDNVLIQLKKNFTTKNAVYKYLQPNMVWGGNLEFNIFDDLHQNSWLKFSEKCINKSEVNIFDCAFLQDHIVEIMLFYNKSEDEIIDYFKRLEKNILPLSPKLYYIQQNNVEKTIENIAKKRIRKHNGKTWSEKVIDLISESLYGRKNKLIGFDGMIEYFKRRQEIELKVIKSLKLNRIIIVNDSYDWKAIQKKIYEALID